MKSKPKKRKNPTQRQSIAAALQNGESALFAGEFAEAIRHFERVPQTASGYSRACKGRGAALLRSGRAAEALPILQFAHESDPEDVSTLVDLGDAARYVGRVTAAGSIFARARELGADGFQIRFGEAYLLQIKELWVQAIDAWAALSESYPSDWNVLHNLGKALHEVGETDRAIEVLERSYRMSGDPDTLAVLAMLSPHTGCCDHEDVLNYRKAFGEHLKDVARDSRDVIADRSCSDKIKIGYVSAFFHRANWMKPVWALINNQDRSQFDVHLFADGPSDEVGTGGGYAVNEEDSIFDTRELSNRDLARLIEQCEVDVLIDLNGYSSVRRLGLWAARPAPVTIGWFNYYATSGMPGIEWLIGDGVVIAPDEEKFYTERVVRLDQSYLTFQVGYSTPDIEFPSDSEPFTYGCLGSAYKITPEVRSAWIRLLKQTNGTRLLVRNRLLGEERHKQWFSSFFTNEGIDADRLILLGPAEHDEFLGTYGRVDIALDTFPYNGGTTTMEALWQGVPVVCFMGDRWVSRTSATIVHAAGLSDFVGDSIEDHLAISARWSSPDHRDKLRKIRIEMRARLEASSVCDGASLARDLERIVLEIRGRIR